MRKNFYFLLALFLSAAGFISDLRSEQLLTPPINVPIQIQSVQSGRNGDSGFWDQPGYNTARYQRGAPVLMFTNERKADQQFTVVPAGNGWYNILTANGNGSVTIEGAKNADGARLVIWDYDKNAANQQYRFVYLGSGRWKIYSGLGRAVTLGNRSSANSSSVLTWSDHDGAWMEWYIVNAVSGQIVMPGPVKGTLASYDTDASGKRTKTVPGVSKIEIMTFDPARNPDTYSALAPMTTASDGSFPMPEKLSNEYLIFLLSHSEGRSSAYTTIEPRSGKTAFENFESELIEKDNYILDDTMYRGRQYYYLDNGFFYRHKGIVTKDTGFFFSGPLSVDKNKPQNAALLKELGGGNDAKNEDERIAKFGRIFAFLGAKTKKIMNTDDAVIKAADNYLFAGCQSSPNGLLKRWPTFDEYAAVYAKYGFIPVGNCTAWTHLTATLMNAAGIPRDTFFMSKFRYDVKWQLEHWEIGFKAGDRWYSVDPQACTARKFNDMASFKRCSWDTTQHPPYDFSHPFEIILMPSSSQPGVPYMGDPAKLKAKLDARNAPVFFQKNKKMSYRNDGLECTTSGTATVKNIEGNVVTLTISAVSTCSGDSGDTKKKSVFEMKITCRNGIYYYGDDASYKGTVEPGGKYLNINGMQNGLRFSVQ